MYCRDCRYPLRDLDVHRCPECGRAFDPNDPDTFDDGSPRNRFWTWISVIGGILFVLILTGMLDYIHSHPPINGWTFWSAAWAVFFLTVVQWIPLMLLVIPVGWLIAGDPRAKRR